VTDTIGRGRPPGVADDVVPTALTDGLARIVGRRYSTSSVRRAAYARDAYPMAIKAAIGAGSPYCPLAVAWPESTSEVAEIIRLCSRLAVPVIPFGGGSGIVGGALSERPSLVLDLKRMHRIRELDEVSLTVTVEAGALGTLLEQRLATSGLTTGHYPQSLNSSTVGGWIAHRGVGTFSTLYGRIDDLVLGLEVVLSDGTILTTRAAPGSAAGPDLKRLFVGSEGTFGVITAAVLRVSPLPEARRGRAFSCATFEVGLEAIRRLIQAGYRPAVVRLYDAVETHAQFAALDLPPENVVLLLISEGPEALLAATESGIAAMAQAADLRELGPDVVDHWFRHRFSTAALVRTLASSGGVADALEVANDWSRLGPTYRRMLEAMTREVGPEGAVYGHLSHVYPSGANLYMIFHTRGADEDSVAERYRSILSAAFEACLSAGGTLTHHHGVGLAKAAGMPTEMGPAGMAVLAAIKHGLDPRGILNPGRLGL
jgi:alkyldihydroxyacetonephosphate synthase